MAEIWSVEPGKEAREALDYWEYFGRRLAYHADLLPGLSVLDLGCGTGSSLFPALDRVGELGSVTGIDLCDH